MKKLELQYKNYYIRKNFSSFLPKIPKNNPKYELIIYKSIKYDKCFMGKGLTIIIFLLFSEQLSNAYDKEKDAEYFL